MHADIEGRSVHWLERGEGELALLVHGFPLDARLWLDQFDPLSSVRRVVAVDLRGCGGSGPVVGSPLTMEALASDLDLLADHLGADRLDLLGLSMGGYVALAFAELFGHRLRSLVLLDTKAEPDSEAGRAARISTAERVVAAGSAAFAEELQGALLGPEASIPVRARLRTMVEATPYETIVATLHGMAERPDRTHVLATVDVPSLVVTGEHDRIAPPEVAEATAAALPDGSVVVIEGAGHLTPMEAPQALNAALRAHLARVDAG